LCAHARTKVGALSTQALCNPLYAPAALDLMTQHVDPRDIVARLIAGDAGHDHRQLHMIDAQGRIGAHTGAACIDWCGHRAGAGYSVAGNMLIGARVVDDTATAYEVNGHLPFAERLVAALAAGEAAGGDKRGKQAAALLVYTTEIYAALDLRVDDHDEPIAELKRLYAKSLERFQPFIACVPKEGDPVGIVDRNEIETRIARFNADRGTGR
jgi:uncharacterized Ntn-hydrolase superfamily protein